MNLVVIEEPDEKWDRFVSQHSGLLFHRSVWSKVLKRSYGCPLRYLVVEKGGHWLCGLPGMIVGNPVFRVFYSLVPYGGFVGDRESITQFLDLVNGWARKQGIHRVQIVDPHIKIKQDLPDFKCVEWFRHVLQLEGKSVEEIWSDYRDSLKRNIKTALSSDLSLESIRSREHVELFYRLYLDSMKRNKAQARYPLELFCEIFDLLIPEFADILFMNHQGRPAAGIVVIYSQKTAHYFHGGSDSNYLHLRPNDLLFHNAIRAAKDKGKSYFDFMGSTEKMPGLIRFKEKWGAQRQVLHNYHKDISRARASMYHLLLPLVNLLRGKR